MRILVIKTKFIGDTVLSSAFFQALKTLHPNAQVTAVVSPLTIQILEHDPHIDAFIVTQALDSHSKKSKRQRLSASVSLVKALKSKQFDQAYVLTRSIYSALLVALSGIKTRIGLATDGRGFLLTHPVEPIFNAPEHETNIKILSVLRPKYPTRTEKVCDSKSAISLIDIKPKYYVLDSERDHARHWLKGQGVSSPSRMVFLHLSGSKSLRRWHTPAWIELANTLVSMGHTLIWSGAASDIGQMQDILIGIQTDTRNASCVLPVLMNESMLPVRQLAAIISLCSTTVSVDTGPMHLSAALSIPTIGLFGPGDPVQWRPIGPAIQTHTPLPPPISPYQAVISDEYLPCRPCQGRPGCSLISPETLLPQCMQGLSAAKVLTVFKTLSLSIPPNQAANI